MTVTWPRYPALPLSIRGLFAARHMRFTWLRASASGRRERRSTAVCFRNLEAQTHTRTHARAHTHTRTHTHTHRAGRTEIIQGIHDQVKLLKEAKVELLTDQQQSKKTKVSSWSSWQWKRTHLSKQLLKQLLKHLAHCSLENVGMVCSDVEAWVELEYALPSNLVRGVCVCVSVCVCVCACACVKKTSGTALRHNAQTSHSTFAHPSPWLLTGQHAAAERETGDSSLSAQWYPGQSKPSKHTTKHKSTKLLLRCSPPCLQGMIHKGIDVLYHVNVMESSEGHVLQEFAADSTSTDDKQLCEGQNKPDVRV